MTLALLEIGETNLAYLFAEVSTDIIIGSVVVGEYSLYVTLHTTGKFRLYLCT